MRQSRSNEETNMRIPGLGGLGLLELSKRSLKAYLEDDMMTYAAALAFRTLFALFPFVIFLVALLGFLRIPGFFDWLLNQAQTVLPEQAMRQVEQVVGQVRDRGQGELLSFGIIVAIWSASVGVRSLMNGLNAAYDVEEERPAWKRYPLSILYTVALALMIILAAGLMFVGPQVVGWLAEQVGLVGVFATVWGWLRWPVAIVLLMLAVAIVYYAGPNVDQPFRLITPGSVLAVSVWIVASLGFSYYVSNFGSYGATYGSLGAVIVLLFYFFISSAVLMFGAEVNAQIHHHVAGDEDVGGEKPDAGELGSSKRK
jgi:membrane protein